MSFSLCYVFALLLGMLLSCLQLALLFSQLWVRSFGFFSSGSSICSCSPSRLTCAFDLHSLPGVAVCECVSLAPRAPCTPSFAVWCLGLSRPCVVLLRSSWHSMSRSPWDSMALLRRFPTSCLPVHVLTHVFAARGLVVPRTTRSPPLCTFCVEGIVSRAVVRRREHLVAGACASKVCTAPFVGLCSAWFPAIVCSGSSSSRRHPSQVISLSADAIVVWFPRLGLRGRLPPKLSRCDSSQLSPLRLCASWSAGTPRRRQARID